MGISTLHVHLDHFNCLEVLVVRGKAATIKKIADELIAAKGVKHGKLTVTSSGRNVPSQIRFLHLFSRYLARRLETELRL